MKRFIPLVALLLGGCFIRAPSATYGGAAPAVSVSVDSFEPYLDPYGTWLAVPVPPMRKGR